MDFVALRDIAGTLDSRTLRAVRQAATEGDAEAQYLLYLSQVSSDRRVGSKTRDLLLRAAELGSLQAQRDLAVCYIWGEDGYEKNFTRARFWYRLAALGGHTESQVACGSMMMRGDGGETLRAEGLSFLEAATNGSDRGDAEAAFGELINIFDGCYGLEAEPERAAEWRQRLAAWEQTSNEG